MDIIAAPPKNIRIERRKFFARRGAESRRALAVCKVFSDESLWEIYKLYANVFRWSGYNGEKQCEIEVRYKFQNAFDSKKKTRLQASFQIVRLFMCCC